MIGTVAVHTPNPGIYHASARRREGCHELANELRWFGQVFAVPGYPVSHILDEYTAMGRDPVWSMNEKNAVESAVGAALSGVPTAVVIKHNGLCVALDSLANAVVHGVGSPFIVIVGDDVDLRGSTSSVDSRTLGAAAGLLTFTPSLDGDIHEVFNLAVYASAQTGAPALVRVTGRLHDQCGETDPNASRVTRLALPRGDEPRHAHKLTKLSRQVRARNLRENVRAEIHNAGLDRVHCARRHGSLIVAVGDAAIPHVDGACHALVRGDVPSAAVRAAVRAHHRVIIVEEGDPLIERQFGTTIGRGSGHLPHVGRLTPSMVLTALRGEASSESILNQRPLDPLSDDAMLFAAISRLRSEGVFVATDVGSSVALSYPPFDDANSALALGSPPAVAAGSARTGRVAIAVLGDFGLLHSGLTGLIEIAGAGLPVMSVVLENGFQAKTGNQPLPAADLDRILADSPVGRVVIWEDLPNDPDVLYDMLAKELALKKPVVIRYRRA